MNGTVQVLDAKGVMLGSGPGRFVHGRRQGDNGMVMVPMEIDVVNDGIPHTARVVIDTVSMRHPLTSIPVRRGDRLRVALHNMPEIETEAT